MYKSTALRRYTSFYDILKKMTLKPFIYGRFSLNKSSLFCNSFKAKYNWQMATTEWKTDALRQVIGVSGTLEYQSKFCMKSADLIKEWNSAKTLDRLGLWGQNTPYIKVLIIRGIGYRAFHIKNDFVCLTGVNEHDEFLRQVDFMNTAYPERNEDYRYHRYKQLVGNEKFDEHIVLRHWYDSALDFKYSRYLILRAGHSVDKYIPLCPEILVRTLKRDRKLVIYGADKNRVAILAHRAFKYRIPSVYTGRGIRRKHIKVIRKAGKRDQQKGRSF